MRRRALGGFLAVLLALAACQSGEGVPSTIAGTSPLTTAVTTTTGTSPATTTTSTTTTLPQGPNEVVIGTDFGEPETLNPYAPGGDSPIVADIAQAIHAGLTEVDGGSGEIVPVLAVEVPSVANGGVMVAEDGTTTVVFRIRDEARWADGVPVTGEDVLFTYEVLAAIEDRPYLTEPYEAITEIAAEGKTVTLTFAQPTLAFETMFPTLIPAHQVRGTDVMGGWGQVPWVSAGPFQFESWQPGESITLTRNDAYWKTAPDGTPLPYLDRVVFRFFPDGPGSAGAQRLVEAVAQGEVDVAAVPPAREFVEQLRGIDGIEVTVRRHGIWEHLTFQFGEGNRNADSLNEHLEFRQAVALALDRQAVAGLGFWVEPELQLDSILDLHGFPTDHPWAQYARDPGRARELIAGLCAELGRDCDADPPVVVFSTTSNGEERPAFAGLLIDMLAGAGMEVRLELEDSSLFFGPTLDNGSWDLAMWAWVAVPGPAGVLASLEFYDPDRPIAGDPNQGSAAVAGSNYGRWGTPAVSGWPISDTIDLNQGPSKVRDDNTDRYAKILDTMRATADREEFEALAREAEQLLADQVVLIPVVARRSVGAVWADRIAGYVHSPWSDTWSIETWRRADR